MDSPTDWQTTIAQHWTRQPRDQRVAALRAAVDTQIAACWLREYSLLAEHGLIDSKSGRFLPENFAFLENLPESMQQILQDIEFPILSPDADGMNTYFGLLRGHFSFPRSIPAEKRDWAMIYALSNPWRNSPNNLEPSGSLLESALRRGGEINEFHYFESLNRYPLGAAGDIIVHVACSASNGLQILESQWVGNSVLSTTLNGAGLHNGESSTAFAFSVQDMIEAGVFGILTRASYFLEGYLDEVISNVSLPLSAAIAVVPTATMDGCEKYPPSPMQIGLQEPYGKDFIHAQRAILQAEYLAQNMQDHSKSHATLEREWKRQHFPEFEEQRPVWAAMKKKADEAYAQLMARKQETENIER